MPENEAFLSENGSKLPVFIPSKFLCSTCAQLLQQTIKNNLYGEKEHFIAANQTTLKISIYQKVINVVF